MDRRRRLAVGFILSLALLGLCVHYGATSDESWPHPTGDQLAENQDEYVGERVLLFGDVQTIGDGTITIHVTDDDGDVAAELEVRNVEPDNDLDPGGFVQVYGVLETESTTSLDGYMDAEELVVVNQSPDATLYKHVVSAIGGLLAAGFFLRHWRIDYRQLRFEPRDETPSRSSGSGDNGDSNSGATNEREGVNTRG
ncbi:DNA-binding protein [Halostagnicola sp. A-GB9-2]|uniref:DNA-binding protein n=1 Tax=Halostagnicola sp. A-GB9-2 TaxID=3048066 RepID=UPI0024BF5C95|nr:DNA-binding protein [Halostagnicola sp. A-GB9-2]MDJ1430840.1 DNA-binding protein [Halostagnicola sp. A-GB9-2]